MCVCVLIYVFKNTNVMGTLTKKHWILGYPVFRQANINILRRTNTTTETTP